MATVRRFEEILAWRKARVLTKDVYFALKHVRDHGFTDQIQRASVSVMSNIAEGFERGTQQEFLNYLYIAKGSAGEVRCQLYVALDVGYISEETFKSLKSQAEECSKLLSSFIKGVKRSDHAGLQRKVEKTKRQEGAEEFDRRLSEYVRKSKDPNTPKEELEKLLDV